MNILFWNLNKKELSKVVNELAIENDIDLFVFCEWAINEYDFLTAVNKGNHIFNEVENFGHDKIKLYSHLN